MTKVKPQSSDDSDVPIDQDADVVAFLRQHVPPVAEADVGEEDRLMMAIAQDKTARNGDRAGLKRLGIGVGCSILVYGLWQLYQGGIPTPRSTTELAEIENFWFQNWDSVANAEKAPPWLAESDSGSDRPEQTLQLKPLDRSPARQE